MALINFKEEPGNYYVYCIDDHGNDANDGLTIQTAVKSLTKAVELVNAYSGSDKRYLVIFKDIIKDEPVVFEQNKPIIFYHIKKTIYDGSGTSPISITVSITNGPVIFKNAIFENFSSGLVPYLMHMTNTFIFENCELYDNLRFYDIFTYGVTNTSFINCIIKDSVFRAGWNRPSNFSFINSVIINSQSIGRDNTSLDVFKNSIIINCPSIIGTNKIIDFCNINGNLGVYSHEQWVALGQNTNGMNVDSQFNDVINNVYTVKQSSPLLFMGEGGRHIGLGEGYYLTGTLLDYNKKVADNFQVISDRLVRVSETDDAYLETNIIDAGGFVSIDQISLAAVLGSMGQDIISSVTAKANKYPAYNSGVTYHIGSGVTDSSIKYISLANSNVGNTPASSPTKWERLTWASGVSYAAGKIVQYTDDKWYKANTATSTSWVAGEWDEVFPYYSTNLLFRFGKTYIECEGKDYVNILFNSPFYVDENGNGTGDDDYDPDTNQKPIFRYYSLIIYTKTIV